MKERKESTFPFPITIPSCPTICSTQTNTKKCEQMRNGANKCNNAFKSFTCPFPQIEINDSNRKMQSFLSNEGILPFLLLAKQKGNGGERMASGWTILNKKKTNHCCCPIWQTIGRAMGNHTHNPCSCLHKAFGPLEQLRIQASPLPRPSVFSLPPLHLPFCQTNATQKSETRTEGLFEFDKH